MKFLRTPLGAILAAVLIALAVLVGGTAVRVYARTHPEPNSISRIDFGAMRVVVEDVSFTAADGLPLRGWLMRGKPDRPSVVLCHDLDENRESLINVAIALNKTGFTTLLFDFRAHGESGGSRSTLGLLEKRDVLGALDFLREQSAGNAERVGIYGVGMGAHAAVLAAAEVPQVRVLVLDSLYPDAAFPLVRDVYSKWGFAERNFSILPRTMFSVLSGASARGERAEEIIGNLPGRHLLLLAPAGDSTLAAEMQRMYERIPDQEDADGNLVVLPATRADALYGSHVDRYHERVAGFFAARLDES